MIHLFKKVYLEIDKKINVDIHRIIISEEFGYTFDTSFNPICAGVHYFSAKNFNCFLKSLGATEQEPPKEVEGQVTEIPQIIPLFDDFYSFINFVDECYEMKKEPLVIYVDQKSFNYFMSYWYKILFLNLKNDSFIFLVKRYSTYSKMFSSSELYWDEKNMSYFQIDEEELSNNFNSISLDEEKNKTFIEKFKKHFSLEFLISSYLYDESRNEELLPIFSLLVRRNIENILYSYRQRIFSYITKKQFLYNIGITDIKKYENFYDIMLDEETILYTFFKKSIWGDGYRTHSVSSSPLKFENITEKDLENIIVLAQKLDMDNWEFQETVNYYKNIDYRTFKNIKSNGTICNKIDVILFLEYFKTKNELTIEEMKKVLYYDVNKNMYDEINFSYTFCSADYSTVNNYFIDYIFDLKRENNQEELKKYILR